MSDKLDVKADVLAERYIKLRDFKEKVSAEMKEKIAKVTQIMDDIELEMMTFLNTSGQESSATKAGTFFKQTKTTASVADRDLYLEFVMSSGATNFLTNHISADAVKEYVAEHDAVPPGVNVTKITSVGVHRPKSR